MFEKAIDFIRYYIFLPWWQVVLIIADLFIIAALTYVFRDNLTILGMIAAAIVVLLAYTWLFWKMGKWQ